MTFDWDTAKSSRNLALRGFDFAFALLIFDATYVEPDGGVVRRLISARLSNRKERHRYAEAIEASRPFDDPE